jgi:hypothetical protein
MLELVRPFALYVLYFLNILRFLYLHPFPLQYLSADSQPPELPATHSTEGE